MDCRDDRLAQKSQALDHSRLEGRRPARRPAHRLEVGASAEGPAGTTQDDTADAAFILLQIGEVLIQLHERLGVERVELVRAIESQRAQAAVCVIARHPLGHGLVS